MKFEKKDSFNDSFLSLSQTKYIQALACIGVILHHLTQITTNYGGNWKGPITIFADIGILFTSLFFFISGYGLMTSLHTKENYLKGFIGHRLPNILIPFWIANIIFAIDKYHTVGNLGGTLHALKYIFGLILLNGDSWYIVEIFTLYLAFYVFFRFIKKENVSLALITTFVLLLIFYAKSRGHDDHAFETGSSWFRGEWWYNSSVVFLYGLYFGKYKDSITSFLKKHYLAKLITFTILLIAFYFIEKACCSVFGYYKPANVLRGISNSTITVIAQSLFCLIFATWCLLTWLKLSFTSKLFALFSKITTEVYLIHRIFINHLTNGVVLNDFVFYLAVFVLAILGGTLLHFVNKGIFALINEVTYKISLANPFTNNSAAIKKLKRGILTILALAIISTILISLRHVILASHNYEEEVKTLSSAKVGDVVTFGHFNTDVTPGDERLKWIVISADNNNLILMTQQGISSGTFNQSYDKVHWLNSQLRERLNSDEFISIFTEQELSLLVPNEDGDLISLLSVEQANNLFDDPSQLKLTSTKIAKINGVNENTYSKVNSWDYSSDKASWWWLRSNETSLTAPIITVDGTIDNSKYVNKPNGAIRPVIIVSID